MAKLQINAAPTFFADVGVPVPGKGEVKVKFEFKHRTRDEFDAWLKNRADRSDAESVMDMVKGWDFDDAFNVENVNTLLQSYIGTAGAVFDTYFAQLVKGRSGN